jgi:hypothetical protein
MSDISDMSEEIERVQLRFSNTFKRLLDGALPDHAHIVDLVLSNPLSEETGYATRVWDAVVAMLLNISVVSLEQFLDLELLNFRLTQEFKPSHHSRMKLVVWRRGSKVLVRFVDELTEMHSANLGSIRLASTSTTLIATCLNGTI